MWTYVNPPLHCDVTGVYLNWHSGQPNGNNTANEDCVAFFLQYNNFEDEDCNEKHYTVCESIGYTSK